MSNPVHASAGWSALAQADRAGAAAAQQAREGLGFHPPVLALCFASSWFDQAALLRGAQSVLGATPCVGGSTAGELWDGHPRSHSCVVVLVSAEGASCTVGAAQGAQANPRNAGQQAAYLATRQAVGLSRAGYLMFGDGLVTDATAMVLGAQEVLGRDACVVGALTGDDLRFERTSQYANGRVCSDGVVGVLVTSPIRLGVGMAHGFAPISKPRRVTRARANCLVELDDRPALAVYEEYFGTGQLQRLRHRGFSRERIAYPLGVQCGDGADWLLRSIAAIESDGSLTCTGTVEEGSRIQLMIGSRELALEAAQRAVQAAIQPLGQVACVLVFESVARRLLLGSQQAGRTMQAVSAAVGPGIPVAGCYVYGEHAPLALEGAGRRTAVQTGSVLAVALGA